VIAYEVMPYINVLAPLVELWILGKLDSRLVVDINRNRVKGNADSKIVNKVTNLNSFFNGFAKGDILSFTCRECYNLL